VPLARMATRIMAGEGICDLGLPPEDREVGYFAVKEAVMPWARFPGADVVLGPEMRSTGEVMGIDDTFPKAYAKTREAIGYALPGEGSKVFVSVCDRDKRAVAPVALALAGLGFGIVSTRGTAKTLRAAGIPCEVVSPIGEGGPNVLDLMAAGEIGLIVNTPKGGKSRGDGALMRSEAIGRGIDLVSTMSQATALVQSIAARRASALGTYALQDL